MGRPFTCHRPCCRVSGGRDSSWRRLLRHLVVALLGGRGNSNWQFPTRKAKKQRVADPLLLPHLSILVWLCTAAGHPHNESLAGSAAARLPVCREASHSAAAVGCRNCGARFRVTKASLQIVFLLAIRHGSCVVLLQLGRAVCSPFGDIPDVGEASCGAVWISVAQSSCCPSLLPPCPSAPVSQWMVIPSSQLKTKKKNVFPAVRSCAC